MSLSYQRLDPVEVRDPRTILENKRDYAILRAGSQTTCKIFTTTSISQSSIQFSCPPPSGGIIVDRKMYLTVPIRLTFTGTAPVGQVLLNPAQDAPRAFPLSSAIDTLQVSINNQAVSIQMADIIQALMHFNTDAKLQELDYSMTPTYLDQSQAYSQLFGSTRSPLANYADGIDKAPMQRGAFPFTIVSNTNTSAIVDMVITEPLFLSPFYWGKHDASGFYNVNTMDFNITFLNQAGNRMWSHDAVSSGVATTINSISATFAGFPGPAFSYPTVQPLMLFTYITPNETQILPYNMPITYPYFDVQRFPTDGNAVTAGSVTTLSSNNIQLNSIPRRMYIYIRERNQDLYSTPNNPDTYFSIENISIQFQNKNGLLASASKQQLYEMSVKNHCNMSWTQWSGGPVVNSALPFGTVGNHYGTIGSILCIEFASDIGLDSIEAPGKLGQYMLQVQIPAATNISNRTITPTLYIVVVSEGSFTIEGLGKASTNIGVISSKDILDAKQSPFVNYRDVQEVNGGNFLSGLKDFGRKLLPILKKGNEFLRDTRAISKGLSTIPHPYAQIGSQAARAIGYGEGVYAGCCMCGTGKCVCNPQGGVVIGGRSLSRSQLKNRLMN